MLMKTLASSSRVAVCTWSLHPTTPEELLEKLRTLEISRVQLALDPLRTSPQVWGRATQLFAENAIGIVSGMFGCVGEDYSTPQSIRRTGGIAPDGTWEQNLKNIKATAALAASLGLTLVTFHAGFLPHEESEPEFAKMLGRLREVADTFNAQKIGLGLETGQESAQTLRNLLLKLNHPNLGVNFDPANMILYEQGNPVEALRLLGPWLRQVHIKDANRTKVPGTWGQEVPVGTGEVDWAGFFGVLRDINYAGDFVIEREAGERRLPDIRQAKEVIERNLA